MDVSYWKGLAACFVCGAALVLAFAPFNVWLLAPVCLAGLFALLINTTPREAALRGLAFGLGLYGFGVSWVYVSLSTYGGMPLWMGSIAVLGFAALLSSLIALMAWLLARTIPSGSSVRLLVLPFAWCIFEWLKSWVLTGFPWLDIGYSQTSTWLAAWAPVGGIYLVSFVVCSISAAMVLWFKARKLLPMAMIVGVTMLSWGLNTVQWTHNEGVGLRVAIVQANVPINQKWESAYRDGVLQQYRDQSQRLSAEMQIDLVVWPETALPMHLQYASPEFWAASMPEGSALLTGIVDTPSLLDQPPSYDRSYNAAVLVCDDPLRTPQVYRKRHLVPFGEYLPLRFLFQWVLDYLELPMSDFYAGSGTQPLNCGDSIRIGLSICYEDAFADEYRHYLGDASVLVNIGEDAWFGDSFAPHQRLQMAQMRARELSRPMVRSANSGPSAFIDHRGVVISQGPQFSAATMVEIIYPQSGRTLFQAIGSWIVFMSILVWIVVWIRLVRQSSKLV